jgi:ActR/RegA family two-component response regulator
MNKDDATEIKQRVSIPMSDADLEKYTGVKPEEILKYSDLKNYASIRELLPNDQDFKIILIEQRSNIGHWVTVMRYGTTCEYFNSYGKPADTDWIFVNRMMRVILGENTKCRAVATGVAPCGDEAGNTAIHILKQLALR